MTLNFSNRFSAEKVALSLHKKCWKSLKFVIKLLCGNKPDFNSIVCKNLKIPFRISMSDIKCYSRVINILLTAKICRKTSSKMIHKKTCRKKEWRKTSKAIKCSCSVSAAGLFDCSRSSVLFCFDPTFYVTISCTIHNDDQNPVAYFVEFSW